MDHAVRLRAATSDDLDAITDLENLTFHEQYSAELRAAEQSMREPERSIVAEDGALVVGHTTAQTRDLTVPGAIVPAAHITGVGVAPTHRRRGLLRAMMTRQLTDLAAAGREPIAVLWASEAVIYQRFGYGPAAERLALEIPTREVRLTGPAEPAPGGRLRLVDPVAAYGELSAIFERQRPDRVGWSSRGEKWWTYLFGDHGDTDTRPPRGVLYETDEGPVAYALYRVEEKYTQFMGPEGLVKVREIVAPDPAAYTILWNFLFGVDLTRTVTFQYAALDDPLQWMVDDARQLGRKVLDAVYVRLVDLPAALEAREYLTPIDVVFEVSDPIVAANAGRWRLSGGPGKATCTRTASAPDLTCSVTELGAAYLGGTTLASLAAAGRVTRHTGNFPSAAFGWHRPPNAVEVF